MKLDQAKRLKEVEQENSRLKRAESELTLDKLILKEALGGYADPSGSGHPCARPLSTSRLGASRLHRRRTAAGDAETASQDVR